MRVRIITVPYDSAHYRKRMGCGPERILDGGLKRLLTDAGHEFECEDILLESTHPAEISAAFHLACKIAERVRDAQSHGDFPLVLSGNCNAAVGTVSGVGTNGTGIVWFDAHGEATTPETTASGFLDGMPISTLLGRAWHALAKTVPRFAPISGEHVALFGARQLEEVERELLDLAGVHRLQTVDELKALLPGWTADLGQIYLHVDLDVLDVAEARANAWTMAGGITLQVLFDSIAEVRRRTRIAALGIGSYDPAVDENGRALKAALRVVEIVLGK